MELRIGDLVQCRDTHYNRGLGVVNKIGMVAQLRRKDVRVLFDADNQAIWVSKMALNRITPLPTDSPTLLDRLTWLIRLVDAEECELDLEESGNYQFTVVCGRLTLEMLLAVREYFAPVFFGLRVLPRGLERLALEVVFKRGT